jgi:hypothetical protein
LKTVEVWYEDKDPVPFTEFSRDTRADGTTVVEYQVSALRLKPGPNRLSIRAWNRAGGERTESGTISYVPFPVKVHLSHLESRDKPGEKLPLTGKGPKAAAEMGSLWLHGTVEWMNGTDPALAEPARVRVQVNDFEQFEGSLDRPVGLKRTFKVGISLNQFDNRVELGFPGLRLADGEDRPTCQVACSHPEQKQRLHLLVLAQGRLDQKGLADSVLEALQARDVTESRFTTPAFQAGHLYQPRTPDREGVEEAVQRIRATIKEEAGTPFQNVVLIYFQGEEVFQDGRHFLLAKADRDKGPSKLEDLKKRGIDCDHLRARLAEVQGAKLLLLDVLARPDIRQPLERGKVPARIGVFHYRWLGDAPPPDQRRLLFALQHSLEGVGLLRDVKKEVLAWALKLGDQAFIDLFNPPGYNDIRLSRGKK